MKQSYKPIAEVARLMESFRSAVNEAIRIGLDENNPSLARMCKLAYHRLEQFHLDASYRLNAISIAKGILSSRNKSLNRGFKTKSPFLWKPFLVSCYRFQINNGRLRLAVGNRRYVEIPLTKHVASTISDLEVRSFSLTPTSLSICMRKEIQKLTPTTFIGVDRNASNVTICNEKKALRFDLGDIERIAERTREITRSFKRNDLRIKSRIFSKYATRRRDRVNHILNIVSKKIVEVAERENAAVVFEDIESIRNLYRKGNGQSRDFRARMNAIPFFELKRQITYKCGWRSIPVLELSKNETMGTTITCSRCGKRTQVNKLTRVLHCQACQLDVDRDVNAAINISKRGRMRFVRSKGPANEAMVQEPYDSRNTVDELVILKVDAGKSSDRTKVHALLS